MAVLDVTMTQRPRLTEATIQEFEPGLRGPVLAPRDAG